jgi:hypothetical protein
MATRKSSSEFQIPKSDDDTPLGTDNMEFEAPGQSGSLDSEAVDAEASEFLQRVDPRVLAAKAEIEKLLGDLATEARRARVSLSASGSMV